MFILRLIPVSYIHYIQVQILFYISSLTPTLFNIKHILEISIYLDLLFVVVIEHNHTLLYTQHCSKQKTNPFQHFKMHSNINPNMFVDQLYIWYTTHVHTQTIYPSHPHNDIYFVINVYNMIIYNVMLLFHCQDQTATPATSPGLCIFQFQLENFPSTKCFLQIYLKTTFSS